MKHIVVPSLNKVDCSDFFFTCKKKNKKKQNKNNFGYYEDICLYWSCNQSVFSSCLLLEMSPYPSMHSFLYLST